MTTDRFLAPTRITSWSSNASRLVMVAPLVVAPSAHTPAWSVRAWLAAAVRALRRSGNSLL
jgi:hypothetical protein